MNTKNSHATKSQHNGLAHTPPANLFSDLARQQLALFNEAASAVLKGSEAVRKIQQQAAHLASTQHESAAERLRAVHEPSEVMTIQSELLRSDLQGVVQYWQQLTAALVQAQVDMISSSGRALMTGLPEGATSAAQNWQSMFANLPSIGIPTNRTEAS
jgi:Phasin protein